MRRLLLVLMVLAFGCATQTDRVAPLERRLDACEKRLEVVQERQKLIEEMLDEALSRWNLVDQAVKRLEKFQRRRLDLTFKSEVGQAYTKAYMLWYRGDYRQAIKAFSVFIARYRDKFLVQQARLLLADSYYRVGKKRAACRILKDFINRYSDSPFVCSAYYKSLKLGCGLRKIIKKCSH